MLDIRHVYKLGKKAIARIMDNWVNNQIFKYKIDTSIIGQGTTSSQESE